MIPKGPPRIPVPVEPFEKILPHRSWRWAERRADQPRRVVDGLIIELVGANMVVMKAPHHVAAVTADIDVFGYRRVDESVDREVCLDKATVPLCLHRRQLHLLGRYAKVKPRRHFGDRQIFRAGKEKLSDDLLNPGGPGFGVRGDDDIVISEAKVVPDGRIKVVTVQLPDLARPREFVHLVFS
jgi:hypothetical protein